MKALLGKDGNKNGDSILSVKNLKVKIPNGDQAVEVLRGIDLSLKRGEILGLVGESGAGKSMLARTLVRLEDPATLTDGEIFLAGRNLARMTEKEISGLRGREISMVPQNPMAAMDPLFSLKSHFREVFAAQTANSGNEHGRDNRSFMKKTVAFLQTVGISSPEERCRQYPHQWSRGMLQRGQLVMAFFSSPSVLVLDEVTSALDPTVCLQILDAVSRLREEHQTAILLITHDLFVAAEICDRLAVIQSGRIVETGPVRELLDRPTHPYARSLVTAAFENGGTA